MDEDGGWSIIWMRMEVGLGQKHSLQGKAGAKNISPTIPAKGLVSGEKTQAGENWDNEQPSESSDKKKQIVQKN